MVGLQVTRKVKLVTQQSIKYVQYVCCCAAGRRGGGGGGGGASGGGGGESRPRVFNTRTRNSPPAIPPPLPSTPPGPFCGVWLLIYLVPCSNDIPPASEGFPMRDWSIRVFLLGPKGEELPATIFEKVTYKLHPTFASPTRSACWPFFLWNPPPRDVGADGALLQSSERRRFSSRSRAGESLIWSLSFMLLIRAATMSSAMI